MPHAGMKDGRRIHYEVSESAGQGNPRLAASTGPAGHWHDGKAFISDWGFALAEMIVPVAVWRAGEDLMVPPSHGEWFAAHISGATGRLEPEEGHISLMFRHFGEIVDQLAVDAGAP